MKDTFAILLLRASARYWPAVIRRGQDPDVSLRAALNSRCCELVLPWLLLAVVTARHDELTDRPRFGAAPRRSLVRLASCDGDALRKRLDLTAQRSLGRTIRGDRRSAVCSIADGASAGHYVPCALSVVARTLGTARRRRRQSKTHGRIRRIAGAVQPPHRRSGDCVGGCRRQPILHHWSD